MFGLVWALAAQGPPPVYVGPLNLTGPAITGLLVGGALWYLSRYFVQVKDYESHRAADKVRRDEARAINDQRIERLERELFAKLTDLQRAVERGHEKQETRYIAREEFNGLGARLNGVGEDLAETRTEARTAFQLAHSASADVRHLTHRLEDAIKSGIDELKRQVSEMYQWRIEEARNKGKAQP